MKSKTYILHGINISLLVLILFSSYASAAVEQWFPTETTTIDYKMMASMTLSSDGTRADSNTFDVYNFSDGLGILPSYMRTLQTETKGTWIPYSLANNTKIVFRVTYESESTTHLKKNQVLVINDTEYKRDFMYLVSSIKDGYFSTYALSVDTSIQRNYFQYSSIPVFFDYMDITKGTGHSLGTFSIITKTDAEFILKDIYNQVTYNRTAIYDLSGKLKSFTYTTSLTAVAGAKSISYSIYLDSSGGSIPFLPTYITIGVIMVTVGMIAYKNRKIIR